MTSQRVREAISENMSLKDLIFLLVIEVSAGLTDMFDLSVQEHQGLTRILGVIGLCIWQGARWVVRRQERVAAEQAAMRQAMGGQ